MKPLLKLSALIDWGAQRLGKLATWLVLVAVLISAGNAISRKLFSLTSNALLEVQWYLFAAVFMLGVGWVFLHNGHVRIDFISSRLSKRTNAILDAAGLVIFVIPLCLLLIDLSWPFFMNAYHSGEMSENAGGLIRWPVIFLIPAGFAVLLLQSISELIKRIAYLTGARDEPFSFGHEKSAEDELVEALGEAEPAAPGAQGERS